MGVESCPSCGKAVPLGTTHCDHCSSPIAPTSTVDPGATEDSSDDWLESPDDLFAQTYPQVLRRAGYHVGFVGKWGLGGPLPKDKFDVFEGFSGQGQYFPKVDGKPVHLTRVTTRHAVDF